MTIVYADEPELSAEDFIGVLQRSGLAERRPVDDMARVKTMLAGADITMTARDASAEGKLIGVARSVTDTAYCCYCSDLAVDRAYQRSGVGRELVAATRRQLHEDCRFFLISAPAAEGYYEHIGMKSLENVFFWPRD